MRACCRAAAGLLDLDDLGADIPKDLRAKQAGHVLGQINDAVAVQDIFQHVSLYLSIQR